MAKKLQKKPGARKVAKGGRWKKPAAAFIALVGIVALVLAAIVFIIFVPLNGFFGSQGPGQTTSAPTTSTAPPGVTTVATEATTTIIPNTPASLGYTVSEGYTPRVGEYMVDGSGHTLYYFASDTVGTGSKDPVSACTGKCAATWKPFYVSRVLYPEGEFNISEFSLFIRSDGSHQLAFRGYPLYAYSGDLAQGDAKGQGLDGKWFVMPADYPPSSQPPSLDQLSVNWAGYAVQTSFDDPVNNSITSASANWVAPAVDCSSSQADFSSSFWVGIDGISSGTVEQIGTDSDCSGGSATYYAWYEIFPQSPVILDAVTVSPGDSMHASVDFVGPTPNVAGSSTFRLTITDFTRGGTFTVLQDVAGASRSSAEWIAEAPVGRNNRVVPLAMFSPFTFTNASVTVLGQAGTIGGTSWEHTQETLGGRGGIVKAQPSDLSSGGSSFTVTWEHS